jgi:hypothetical protein
MVNIQMQIKVKVWWVYKYNAQILRIQVPVMYFTIIPELLL